MPKLCDAYVNQCVVSFLTEAEKWRLTGACKMLFLRRTLYCCPTISRAFLTPNSMDKGQNWLPTVAFNYKSTVLCHCLASHQNYSLSRVLHFNLQKITLNPTTLFPTSLTSLTLLQVKEPFDLTVTLPLTLRELVMQYTGNSEFYVVPMHSLTNMVNLEFRGRHVMLSRLPTSLQRLLLDGDGYVTLNKNLLPPDLTELIVRDKKFFSLENHVQPLLSKELRQSLRKAHITNDENHSPLPVDVEGGVYANLRELRCCMSYAAGSFSHDFALLMTTPISSALFPNLRVLHVQGMTEVHGGYEIDFRHLNVLEELHIETYADTPYHIETGPCWKVGAIHVPNSLRILTTNLQSLRQVQPLLFLTTIIVTDNEQPPVSLLGRNKSIFLEPMDRAILDRGPSYVREIAPACTKFGFSFSEQPLLFYKKWLKKYRLQDIKAFSIPQGSRPQRRARLRQQYHELLFTTMVTRPVFFAC